MNRSKSHPEHWRLRRYSVPSACGIGLLLGGCPNGPSDNSIPAANPTDKSNQNARYVGSAACASCHADVASLHGRHPHEFALNRLSGQAPAYPAGTGGVPNPPPGLDWTDVSYVSGGYSRGALFLGVDGFLLTTGITAISTQWNLAFGPNGATSGFVPLLAESTEPAPFEYARFVHETTGAEPQDASTPASQDSRAGIEGTWSEPGVHCEACHGPGSNHFFTLGGEPVVNPARIFTDLTGAQTCNACHAEPFGDTSGVILASGGFVRPRQQASELRASGGHRTFTCTTCHDPHRPLNDGRAVAIRNDCTACHRDATMAGHRGKTFRRSDGYTEQMRCESCHMPYAARAYSTGTPPAIAEEAHIGDVRSHIFRISTSPAGVAAFLSADGHEVQRDPEGRAAVTVDYVCLRCHNGDLLFSLTTARAAEIAPNVHRLPED